jgi:hypothetical protein
MKLDWLNSKNNSDNLNLILDLLKICFIAFFAFSVLTQMWPYFKGYDSYFFATSAIGLSNGSWGFSNELLSKTELWEFVPMTYTKTLQNDAIPIGGLGMHGLTTLAYVLAGQYGLLYLVPMFTILLIIAIDRISLKLFGRFVAFVSVLLAGTTYWLIGFGVQLYTESIFTLFFIMGIYFLIKFHRDKKATLIFLTSSFLVAAAFIRTNGIVSLPLEIILVIGVLFLPILQKNEKQEQKTTLNHFYFYFKTNQKSIYKVILFMMIPWMVFFLISGFYNYYFFGDPSLGSYESRPHSELEWSLKTALQNWSSDIFTWIEYNAVFLIPDKLFAIFSDNSPMINVTPWNNIWIGVLSLLLILSAVIISFLSKNKRLEIVTLSLFIFATLLFYALGHMSRVFDLENYSPRNLVVYDAISPIRYMIPVFPLFHILLGYIMYKIWKINLESVSKLSFRTMVKYLKFGFLGLVILFFVTSFLDSFIFTQLVKGEFTNPQKELEKHFPINREGLPQKSVIVGLEHYKTMEYGLIPFYPYWGFNFVRINIDQELIPQEPISTLKILLDNENVDPSTGLSKADDLKGYSVFVFKDHIKYDTIYYHYLESKHGIILKDYSASFCKMELGDLNQNPDIYKGDPICYLKK